MVSRKVALANSVKDTIARVAWTLPHDVRRSVFRRLRPQTAALHDSMRQNALGDVPGLSVALKPAVELRCIFLHIPKNGGTSVGRTLFGEYGGNHMPMGSYQLIYDRADFESFHKFCFSRNPYDRLLSGYRFGTRGATRVDGARESQRHVRARKPLLVSAFGESESFEQFVLEWVNPANVRIFEHLRPQHRFACDPSGKLAVDFVGRVENFDADFQTVCERLGVERELMHDRQTHAADSDAATWRDEYTPAMRKVVEEVYAKDLRLFDYTFDG